jgi:hypothetical protein
VVGSTTRSEEVERVQHINRVAALQVPSSQSPRARIGRDEYERAETVTWNADTDACFSSAASTESPHHHVENRTGCGAAHSQRSPTVFGIQLQMRTTVRHSNSDTPASNSRTKTGCFYRQISFSLQRIVLR